MGARAKRTYGVIRCNPPKNKGISLAGCCTVMALYQLQVCFDGMVTLVKTIYNWSRALTAIKKMGRMLYFDVLETHFYWDI